MGRPQSCTIHVVVSRSDVPEVERLVSCLGRELDRPPTGAPPTSRQTLPMVAVQELQPFQGLDLTGVRNQETHRQDLASPFNFVRFYLREYLPATRRALWLDTDTIVRADVAPLYRMPLRDPVAAVSEFSRRLCHTVNMSDARLQGLIYAPDMPIIQAGVLLIDLRRWSSANLTRRVEGWIDLHRTRPIFTFGTTNVPLNLALQDGVDLLDWRWNLHGLGHAELDIPPPCLANAKILHWSRDHKPWRRRHNGLSPAPHFKLFEPYIPTLECE